MSDSTKEAIETISLEIRYEGEKFRWAVGEIKVNGEELSSGTAPSWHGVWDMLGEAFNDACWGDDAGNPGWLK